jgi:predicted Fe-Mo cluster-binding NifX family protein
MKIAISTSGASIDAPYDPRFGRAAHFCIIDEESEDWEATPNPAISASGGAGVQAAQFIAGKEVKIVISGAFGPNAFDTLDAAGIKMYLAPAGENLTVSDLLKAYRDRQLNQAQAPSHGGHHGGRRGDA